MIVRFNGHSWRLFRVLAEVAEGGRGVGGGRGLQQSADECELYMGNDGWLRPEEVKEGKLRVAKEKRMRDEMKRLRIE
jgi:hypothetical protein